MPPAQCPECGRFLARSFVLGLATQPEECPKCGTRLSSAHFPQDLGQAAAPEAPSEEPAAAADLRDEVPPDPGPDAVRPPDLDPDAVGAPSAAPDPLAGWDRPGQADLAVERHEPPPDAAILAGTGVVGAVIGALLSHRRANGAAWGLLVGVLAAAVARQVWRLPD